MRAGALLLAFAILSGCMAGEKGASPTPSVTPSSSRTDERFDAAATLPSGWTSDSGAWSVVADPGAPSRPNVVRGEGAGSRSTLRSPAAYRDVDANLSFKILSGDEGVGVSFRYASREDYRIVRYSAREAGWHYFIMRGETADKPAAATVSQTTSHPPNGQWVNLRVRAVGAHVQAWHDQTLVIDYMDPNTPSTGGVGPFLRASAVAVFDNVVVDRIPGP